jgi:Mrp family chromosome partitioning ATPase
MSQPPPPIEPHARRAFGSIPLLAAVVVALAFVGYGMLAPTTYRATAQIVLKPLGDKPLTLPTSPSVADRLRGAAVDAETLLQTASALGLGTDASAQAAAKAQIEARLEVRSAGPDVIEFSFTNGTAESTEKVTNLLTRHAATRAAVALSPAPLDAGTAREAARSRSAAELAAFMAAHPELTPQSPSVVPVTPKDAPKAPAEPELSSLRAERDQLEAKLSRLPDGGGSSDNPFGAGAAASAEAKRMKRRLAEIDQQLAARKRAERKVEAAPQIAPEVEREWKRLLQAVANPVVTEAAAAEPTFTVMLREATRPTAPIEPNRRLIAILAGVGSLATALGLTLLRAFLIRGRADVAPRYQSDPPRHQSDPPRHYSEPPRQGSEPPRPGSDPPRHGSEPPRPGSEPPPPGDEPPRAYGSEPPRPASDPPRADSSAPPRPPSDPPRPGPSAAPLPMVSISGTQVISSAPPPDPIALGNTMASPTPPAPERATSNRPAEGGSPGLSLASSVPKGTLVGMAPFDPRTLDSTLVAQAPEKPAGAGPFNPAPSVREPEGPRSTLRPPPPARSETQTATSEGVLRERQPGKPPPSSPGDPDGAWTGPSRAHRRSVPAARRTTQMLGSPIPPVTRGSTQPPSDGSGSAQQRSSTYSYVSSRPPAPPARQNDTPPYYQAPPQDAVPNRRHPPSTPRPPMQTQKPAERPRVTKHALRTGWRPESGLDPRQRRALAEELLPLAVDKCLVIGVTSVAETRGQKSRVAAELALALAEPQHPRVLLLEGDFQSASVHQVMRVDMPLAAGFSQQLRAMGRSTPQAWTVVEVGPTLHVLGEGIMRSPGLILSMQFEESIRSFRAYYDLIVLDGPDLSSEVECRALANAIDGVVYVAPALGSPDLARGMQLFPDLAYSTVVGV